MPWNLGTQEKQARITPKSLMIFDPVEVKGPKFSLRVKWSMSRGNPTRIDSGTTVLTRCTPTGENRRKKKKAGAPQRAVKENWFPSEGGKIDPTVSLDRTFKLTLTSEAVRHVKSR